MNIKVSMYYSSSCKDTDILAVRTLSTVIVVGRTRYAHIHGRIVRCGTAAVILDWGG